MKEANHGRREDLAVAKVCFNNKMKATEKENLTIRLEKVDGAFPRFI